jgi:EAL domain-containing protein (putative c-di-GMP-specific phosphodiesterase class I)
MGPACGPAGLRWPPAHAPAAPRSTGREAAAAGELLGAALSNSQHAPAPPGDAAGGELVVYYQPIYSLQDAAVVTVEALMRWRTADGRVLGAAAALAQPATPEARFALDLAVLRRSCTDLVALLPDHAADGLCTVNVNLTPTSLQRPDLDEQVLAVLAETGLAPEHLRFEVPETAALAELAIAADGLRRITSSGIALTLDDVGVDDVGLRYLKALTIDGIKTDQTVTASILDEDGDRLLGRLLVNLCHGLDVRLTFEGVERCAHMDAARALGVRAVQGHHVSPPLPLDELRAFLRSTAGGDCERCFPQRAAVPS